MEDEIDNQEMEYVVEQYETQANEMEGIEDESCEALMVNSEVAEDSGVHYEDKYEDEDQWHSSAKEDIESLREIRDLYISEGRYVSPGSTEISRANFCIRHRDENFKMVNTIKEVKLDSCGSVSLAHSKYLSSIKPCSQYNIPIVTLNGIGGRTLPITNAGILTHVTPQRKLIKFLCYVFDTPIGNTQEMLLLGLKQS